ncbi:MAG TPA: amino acid ABC transporter permease [Deinococcales bacterium]|nr:amino acid ABC transporter permease [Deinococcales bacterium]
MDLVIQSLPVLLQGALITLGFSAAAMVFGLILGLLTALARLSRVLPLRAVSTAYVSIIRGTPLLVQIFVIYYGLPGAGITLDPITSGILALSLNVGAYVSETIRGAILSLDRGQWDAALSLGMRRAQAYRFVILPQAFRNALPALSNSFISLIKDTSLVSVITVVELLRSAQLVIARTFQPLPLYLAAAVIYWVLSTVLSSLQGRMEARLASARQRA